MYAGFVYVHRGVYITYTYIHVHAVTHTHMLFHMHSGMILCIPILCVYMNIMYMYVQMLGNSQGEGG